MNYAFSLFTKVALFVGLAYPALAEVTREEWSAGSSSVTEAEVIPKGFLGKWSPSMAGCLDKDGVEQMYIYPNGIDFYESGGRVERITNTGQNRSVLMKLAFEGEGGFWDKTWKLVLSPDGKRVVISLEDGTSSENYVKCPLEK